MPRDAWICSLWMKSVKNLTSSSRLVCSLLSVGPRSICLLRILAWSVGGKEDTRDSCVDIITNDPFWECELLEYNTEVRHLETRFKVGDCVRVWCDIKYFDLALRDRPSGRDRSHWMTWHPRKFYINNIIEALNPERTCTLDLHKWQPTCDIIDAYNGTLFSNRLAWDPDEAKTNKSWVLRWDLVSTRLGLEIFITVELGALT